MPVNNLFLISQPKGINIPTGIRGGCAAHDPGFPRTAPALAAPLDPGAVPAGGAGLCAAHSGPRCRRTTALCERPARGVPDPAVLGRTPGQRRCADPRPRADRRAERTDAGAGQPHPGHRFAARAAGCNRGARQHHRTVELAHARPLQRQGPAHHTGIAQRDRSQPRAGGDSRAGSAAVWAGGEACRAAHLPHPRARFQQRR
ncbi:hypothetical protein G6F32_014798 [Rhizopus arrhizus]|nr:hypothetical protein G6F32_014798 [Rhizopus arrhizus]